MPSLLPYREGLDAVPPLEEVIHAAPSLDGEGTRRYTFLLRIASSTASAVIGMCRTRTPMAL
jgi:hypothetical protein